VRNLLGVASGDRPNEHVLPSKAVHRDLPLTVFTLRNNEWILSLPSGHFINARYPYTFHGSRGVAADLVAITGACQPCVGTLSGSFLNRLRKCLGFGDEQMGLQPLLPHR
jgi:hypothetical protein